MQYQYQNMHVNKVKAQKFSSCKSSQPCDFTKGSGCPGHASALENIPSKYASVYMALGCQSPLLISSRSQILLWFSNFKISKF